jgi:hypothetical protein
MRAEPGAAGSPGMFVYRDSGDDQHYREPDAAAAAEREAAYWYGPAEAVTAGREPAEPVRGPFEPFTGAGDAPPAGEAGTDPAWTGPGDASGADEDEPVSQHVQKLEQLKDLYLTAEAIGEQNVDKHFDQLLAQQRELISEYFKESVVRREEPGRTGAEPTEAGAPGMP